MKALDFWQRKAARELDERLTYQQRGFQYEARPEGVYFSSNNGRFVWFLKDYAILTADVAGERSRQTEGLHKLITDNHGKLVAYVQKGFRVAGKRVHYLSTDDGKEAFMPARYFNALPQTSLFYYDPEQESVVAALWDGSKMERIAGFKVTAIKHREKPSRMVTISIYRDSSGLYDDDEYQDDNIAEIDFPEEIVRAWYGEHKTLFDNETAEALKCTPEEATFEKWLREVCTCDDFDGICDFARERGFNPVRPSN